MATTGPIAPTSVYLGGASGNLFPSVYVPATNTNGAGAFEGIGVIASLAADASAILQFQAPGTIPSGTLKLLCWAMAFATSGVAKVTVSDAPTASGSNIGTTTLTAETQLSQTWTTADIIVQNKVTLTGSSAVTSLENITVDVTFNHTSWTLAATSTWYFALIWE